MNHPDCILESLHHALADLPAGHTRESLELSIAQLGRMFAQIVEDNAMLRGQLQMKEYEIQGTRVLLGNSQSQVERYRCCLERAEATRAAMLWGLYLPAREGRP